MQPDPSLYLKNKLHTG